MAIFVATDYYVSINAVDLSDWVTSVELPLKAAALDKTTMGQTTKVNIGGLKEWTLTVTGKQDYAAGGPDATLNGIVGSTVTIIAKPTSSADGATNPAYTGSAVLTDYNPIAGTIGEVPQFTATFSCGGALTRDVTP